MASVPEDTKQILKDRGLWAEFNSRRDEYRQAGLSAVESRDRSFADFLAEDEIPEIGKPKKRYENEEPPKVEYRKRAKPGPKPKSEEPEKKSYRRDGETQVKYPCFKIEDVSGDAFEGKDTNVVDVILWVGANMRLSNVRPEDAPSSAAWNMLMQCKASPAFANDFWKNIYPKVMPSRSELREAEKGHRKDGNVVIGHLRKVYEMRRKAVEGASHGNGTYAEIG